MTTDILERLANSRTNESSHDLYCRCFDAAEEISRLRAQATEWTHIDKDLPPCDGHTIYVGINFNGNCAHFNEFCITTKYDVTCVYKTAEGHTETMSGLKYWKKTG